ncbi:MAG TPA: hypothetical protein VNR39_00085 [Pseudolabrys sp.]|nr:hypothetical protein [Pseudolabrys sp.]
MDLIRNERTKLLANAVNNTAVAVIVTTVITPLAGLLYGIQPVPGAIWFAYWFLWLFVGVGLHFSAQAVLGRLTS